MRHIRMRAAILLVLALAGIVVTGTAAGASCAEPSEDLGIRLAAHDAVFVGTVTATRGEGRLAEVVVESVWHGEVRARVEVWGSSVAEDPNASSSVDRAYVRGRYLFAVSVVEDRLADSLCSPTRRWRDDLDALRPDAAPQILAATPTADADEEAASPPLASPGAASAPLDEPPTARGRTAALAVALVLVGLAAALQSRVGPRSGSRGRRDSPT